MSKFSQRLKEVREEQGISQEDLAKILGYRRQTISSWENNGKEPSYDILIKLSKKLNVTIDYLLGNID